MDLPITKDLPTHNPATPELFHRMRMNADNEKENVPNDSYLIKDLCSHLDGNGGILKELSRFEVKCQNVKEVLSGFSEVKWLAEHKQKFPVPKPNKEGRSTQQLPIKKRPYPIPDCTQDRRIDKIHVIAKTEAKEDSAMDDSGNCRCDDTTKSGQDMSNPGIRLHLLLPSTRFKQEELPAQVRDTCQCSRVKTEVKSEEQDNAFAESGLHISKISQVKRRVPHVNKDHECLHQERVDRTLKELLRINTGHQDLKVENMMSKYREGKGQAECKQKFLVPNSKSEGQITPQVPIKKRPYLETSTEPDCTYDHSIGKLHVITKTEAKEESAMNGRGTCQCDDTTKPGHVKSDANIKLHPEDSKSEIKRENLSTQDDKICQCITVKAEVIDEEPEEAESQMNTNKVNEVGDTTIGVSLPGNYFPKVITKAIDGSKLVQGTFISSVKRHCPQDSNPMEACMNGDNFNCGLCVRGFDSTVELQNHLLSHTTGINQYLNSIDIETTSTGRQYHCYTCNIIYASRKALHRHRKMVHKDGKYKDSGKLRKHKITQQNEKQYKCKVCEELFMTRSMLSDHISTHHNGRPFKCHHCGKGFKRQSSLNAHIPVHTGKWPYTCETCGKGFQYLSKKSAHMYKHNGEKTLPCPVCGKLYALQHQLNAHMESHAEERKYECNVCFKKFKTRHVLWTHSQIHKRPREKMFKCDQCEKTYTTERELRCHKGIHEGISYDCQKCGYSFNNPNALRKHMIKHSKGSLYTCETCGVGCHTEAGLQIHMRKQHGELFPFQCGVCGMGFTKHIKLAHHMSIHNQRWSYSCVVCGKGYNKMCRLLHHLTSHTVG